MNRLTAIRRTSSGFSDVPAYEDEVTIVGFVYGRHRDACGLDRFGECALAVYVMADGSLDAGPLSWFRITGAARCAIASETTGEPQ